MNPGGTLVSKYNINTSISSTQNLPAHNRIGNFYSTGVLTTKKY